LKQQLRNVTRRAMESARDEAGYTLIVSFVDFFPSLFFL